MQQFLLGLVLQIPDMTVFPFNLLEDLSHNHRYSLVEGQFHFRFLNHSPTKQICIYLAFFCRSFFDSCIRLVRAFVLGLLSS